LVASAGLATGLIAGGAGAAGAAAHTGAATAAATPVLTIPNSANLKAGSSATLKGSGWGPNEAILFAACNLDGATGQSFTSQSCKVLNGVNATSSASGTFSTTMTMPALGVMSANAALSKCPVTQAQLHLGISCVISAVSISPFQVAVADINFAPHALTFHVSKGSIKGKFNVTVKYAHAGEPISSGSAVNNAGFGVEGTWKSGGKTLVGGCQSTSVPGSYWIYAGKQVYSPCTGVVGERVRISANGKVLGKIWSKIGAGQSGDLHRVYKNLAPGKYKFQAKGLTTGQIATGTVKVG
jgi:hypothetical protein